jgi:hypothetical protein
MACDSIAKVQYSDAFRLGGRSLFSVAAPELKEVTPLREAVTRSARLRVLGAELAGLDTKSAEDVTSVYEAQAIISRLLATQKVDVLRSLIATAIDLVPDLRNELESYRTRIKRAAPRLLSVFLCHASEDKDAVRNLRKSLLVAGTDPWLDEDKLVPGQDWRLEITRAIRACDVILACLSRAAVSKESFVQREIKLALDQAEEKPEGTIFIIPVRLEDCPLPPQLQRWQAVDLFKANGIDRLEQALKIRAQGLGIV